MTSIDELTTPTNSLKAGDLDGEEVTLVIAGYTIKEFEQTDEKTGNHYTVKKPILTFKGTEKNFVCNKTNQRSIAYAYGKEMDDWVGKEIILYPTQVSFGTKEVDAIRVRANKPGKGKPKFLETEKELDDEIPF